MVPREAYKWVLVSAGSNDAMNSLIDNQLQQLRAAIRSKHVMWIYPRAVRAAWAVCRIAQTKGDGALGLNALDSQDGVHPSNYRRAVAMIFARQRVGIRSDGTSIAWAVQD